MALAASRYSICRSFSTMARVFRTEPGIAPMHIARMVFIKPLPRAVDTRMASRVLGMADQTSQIRMAMLSTAPP